MTKVLEWRCYRSSQSDDVCKALNQLEIGNPRIVYDPDDRKFAVFYRIAVGR